MRITWLGHSTVLLEAGGLRLLTDPVLRPRTGALRRVVPVPPAWREGVDLVLLSHLHHDHCDLPSLRRLAAPVLAPMGSAAWLARRGIAVADEVSPGHRVEVGSDVRVTAVHAHHHGRREPFGPWAHPVGHVVETRSGAVWLAGDTSLHPAMTDLARDTRNGRIDVAVVPVWGWGPELGPGHLTPRTAAEAVARSGAAAAIPVHWGTLYPVGLRLTMRRLLRTPGVEFAGHLAVEAACARRPVTAHVLPVGGVLEPHDPRRIGVLPHLLGENPDPAGI